MADGPDRLAAAATTPGSVADAMNRVLAAERAAATELDACRAQADRRLAAARREARAILEHAEHLAREIHGRTERLARAHTRRLVEAAAQRDPGQDREDLLQQAVDRLAARMTGEDHA